MADSCVIGVIAQKCGIHPLAGNCRRVDDVASLRKSVGEVACAVGYDSAVAFSTAFEQCFGVSPSSYASDGG